MEKSRVAVVRVNNSNEFGAIKDTVQKAIELIGGLDGLIKPRQKILINPSWVAPPTETEKGCITQMEVTEAVAQIVKELGALPIIAESSAVGVDSLKIIEGSSYRTLRGKGYEVVDLKKTEVVTVAVPDGMVFKEIETFRLVLDADVIILIPKLKTHDQTEMTCAIKKIKGLLTDKYKRLMHQEGLFDGVIDFLSVLKPQLTIVDAIYCQEGLGPVFGRPVKMDLILAGRDPIAVDSVAGRIIGYEPGEVLLTRKGSERGLGTAKPEGIEVSGEPVKSVWRRFLRAAEDNPVEVEGFNLFYGGITCTGCRNTVMSALADMRNADQLMYLPGVTVITGDPEIPATIAKGSIVAVGKCVPQPKRGENYVKGCPPNNAYVVQAIIGDRRKAKRMYAEGNLESEK
jgi:uncharacterized protein (DUF362 family)